MEIRIRSVQEGNPIFMLLIIGFESLSLIICKAKIKQAGRGSTIYVSNPSTWDGDKDQEFKVSLSYMRLTSLKLAGLQEILS